MATESNAGLRHAISFRSGGASSSATMIPMGNYPGAAGTSSTGFVFSGNVINGNSGLLQPGNSTASLFLDSVPGVISEAGPSVEWSAEEQYKLEEGLEIYKDKSNISKYVKIAATLPEKTVRDVALRCRWMARKRRKGEEHTKKVSNRKDKLLESSPNLNIPLNLSQKSAMYPPILQSLCQNAGMSSEGLSGIAMHLLQQNALAFGQISSNLSMYKLKDNINLFCQTRNNIAAILDEMRGMPGIMSQMPPLPVSIDEDLVTCFLPNTTQQIMGGIPPSIHLK